MKTTKRLQILICVVAIFSFMSCGYNSIQKNEEDVFRAWGDLEVQLQRRMDLIPNLVSTVKGYAKQEKETLTAVVEARSKATSVTITTDQLSNKAAMQQFSESQGAVNSSLSRLLAVVENYPDLKSNQNYLDLQNQLEGTENRISVARTRYNEAVDTFNRSIRIFPNSLTNSLFLKLERKEYFKAEQGAQKAPTVSFE